MELINANTQMYKVFWEAGERSTNSAKGIIREDFRENVVLERVLKNE